MAFAGINHEFRLHSQRLQRVPEFVGLRRRALLIAIAHHHQRRRLDVLDEVDGRAFRIHRRIVVHRRAEIRNHPLIDSVLPVIALPVRDARARERRAEAMRLRDRPHGHVTAVAPARDADALIVHRIALHHRVHAGQNIVQIAVPEILHVGAREIFALPITAARIRHEDEVALPGKQLQRQLRARPTAARATDAGPPCTSTSIG